MCSVNFIDAPELVKKTIVNKELSKIKDGKNYSSDTIIDIIDLILTYLHL